MIKPTIGRTVLYNDGKDQRRPATICYVWSENLINIGGLDRDGKPFNKTSVNLLQDDSECPVGCAEWPTHVKEANRYIPTTGVGGSNVKNRKDKKQKF